MTNKTAPIVDHPHSGWSTISSTKCFQLAKAIKQVRTHPTLTEPYQEQKYLFASMMCA